MISSPRKLNLFQKTLVAPRFVYSMLAYVAVLGGIDVVRIARWLALRPFEPVPHASSIAIRLVLAGVFFELRSKFVEHLLGNKAEARGPLDEHMSHTCEIYGGYLTVAGLFIELADNTREVFDASRFASPFSTAIVLVFSVMSFHVMFDLARELRRGPEDRADGISR